MHLRQEKDPQTRLPTVQETRGTLPPLVPVPAHSSLGLLHQWPPRLSSLVSPGQQLVSKLQSSS
jgi:hypothetical protein